jgi:hypothetical protein
VVMWLFGAGAAVVDPGRIISKRTSGNVKWLLMVGAAAAAG